MRVAFAVLIVVTAASRSLGAQSQSHGPEHAAPAPGQTITVTGCLARGVEPRTFVLKNVAWPSSNVPSGGQTRGSEPVTPTATSPSAETLRLAGDASTLGLEAYVGHIISAVGALSKTDPLLTTGAVLPEPQGDTTSRTRAADQQAASTLRTFELRSMTDVASRCR